MAKIHRRRVDWTGVSVNSRYDPSEDDAASRHPRQYPHVSLAEKRHIDRGFYGDAAIDEIGDTKKDGAGRRRTPSSSSSSSSSSSGVAPMMQRGAGGIRLWRRGKGRRKPEAQSYVIPATNGAKNIAKGETTALGASRRWRGQEEEEYGWNWNG